MRYLRSRGRRWALSALVVVPALALAGCGGVDTGKLNNAITSEIQQKYPSASNVSVNCPGNIPDQPTHQVTCLVTMTLSGHQLLGGATATINHTTLVHLSFSARPTGGSSGTPPASSTPGTTT